MSRADREHGFTPAWRSAEHGFKPGWRSAEHGFTLIEMLVALAVFSIAALALLRLEGATVANTAVLRTQAVAQIVARNVAVDALSVPAPVAYGDEKGGEENGGRDWRWLRRTSRTADASVQRIDVAVADDQGRRAAQLTVFRLITQ